MEVYGKEVCNAMVEFSSSKSAKSVHSFSAFSKSKEYHKLSSSSKDSGFLTEKSSKLESIEEKYEKLGETLAKTVDSVIGSLIYKTDLS